MLDGGPVVSFTITSALIAHEAAHAIVMVRLGLPLRDVSVATERGRDGLYHGGAAVDEGASHRWQDDPAALEAREAFEKMAAVYMAGVDCDNRLGQPAECHCHDVELAVIQAAFLGIGGAAVGRFLDEAQVVAARELGRDGGAAWKAVYESLDREPHRLTGGEVRQLIRQSDEARRRALT